MDFCNPVHRLIYLPARCVCVWVGVHAFTICLKRVSYVNTCLLYAPMQCGFVSAWNYCWSLQCFLRGISEIPQQTCICLAKKWMEVTFPDPQSLHPVFRVAERQRYKCHTVWPVPGNYVIVFIVGTFWEVWVAISVVSIMFSHRAKILILFIKACRL